MIALLNTVEVTFYRQTDEVEYDEDGRAVNAAAAEIITTGSLQPVKGQESQRVDLAGKSSQDALRYYTTTKLVVANQYTNTEADIATIDGITYEVFGVEDWSRNGLNNDHYKVILVRHEQTENPV